MLPFIIPPSSCASVAAAAACIWVNSCGGPDISAFAAKRGAPTNTMLQHVNLYVFFQCLSAADHPLPDPLLQGLQHPAQLVPTGENTLGGKETQQKAKLSQALYQFG
jgi:hypothetical protein